MNYPEHSNSKLDTKFEWMWLCLEAPHISHCPHHQICANIMEYCQTLLLQSSAEAQFTVCLFSPSASEPTGQSIWPKHTHSFSSSLSFSFFLPVCVHITPNVSMPSSSWSCVLSSVAQTWQCHQYLGFQAWVWFCSCSRTVPQTSFDTMTATDRVSESSKGWNSLPQRNLKRYILVMHQS